MTVSVVAPAQWSSETAQTPGSQRVSAISPSQGIRSSLWGGVFQVEPGAKTGVHHHGDQDTIVYVLEGEAVIRWGGRGEFSATARAGEFVHVPAWLPHQEINPSAQVPFRWVVVRNAAEPKVVPLPDSMWEGGEVDQPPG